MRSHGPGRYMEQAGRTEKPKGVGAKLRSHAVSNIPSTAISAALTPIQREANHVLRARGVQLQKNQHHSEEVNELDDTAVNSVHDQQERQGGGGEQNGG